MLHKGLPANLDEKLRWLSQLDAQITRAKGTERRALVKGAVLGVAVFAMLGAWTPGFETPFLDFFRYGCAGLLFGFEYGIRRLHRRGLESKLREMMDRPSMASDG